MMPNTNRQRTPTLNRCSNSGAIHVEVIWNRVVGNGGRQWVASVLFIFFVSFFFVRTISEMIRVGFVYDFFSVSNDIIDLFTETALVLAAIVQGQYLLRKYGA